MRTKWKRYKRPLNERVGNFFFTLGIIFLIIGILPIIATVANIAYYVIVGVIIIATLGLILLNKDIKEKIFSGDQIFKDIATLIKYSPYILGASSLFFLIATIIYAKSNTLHRKGGNVTAGVFFTIIPILIIIIIIYIRNKVNI